MNSKLKSEEILNLLTSMHSFVYRIHGYFITGLPDLNTDTFVCITTVYAFHNDKRKY